jgi:hypothetical protein
MAGAAGPFVGPLVVMFVAFEPLVSLVAAGVAEVLFGSVACG